MASATTSVPRRMLEKPLWLGRLAWFALPLVYGPGVASVVGRVGSDAAIVIETSAWLGWFVGLVAWLVPAPVSLTVIRMLSPMLVVGPLWATVADGPTATILAAVVGALANAAVVFSPAIGDAMIDASSYGPERRLALRPGAGALLAAPVLWTVAATATVVGPTLVAGGRRELGAAATLAGLAMAAWITKGLHRLSRRWLVFVPAGVVVHDAVTLAEPVLVPRARVERFGPATVEGNGDRLDLSADARGLGLTLALTEPLKWGVRHGRDVHETTASEVVVAPSLTGQTLHQARIRGFRT